VALLKALTLWPCPDQGTLPTDDLNLGRFGATGRPGGLHPRRRDTRGEDLRRALGGSTAVTSSPAGDEVTLSVAGGRIRGSTGSCWSFSRPRG
jgi:hypothetical protein